MVAIDLRMLTAEEVAEILGGMRAGGLLITGMAAKGPDPARYAMPCMTSRRGWNSGGLPPRKRLLSRLSGGIGSRRS